MRFAVDIIESERGWGSKVDERKYFPTYELPHKFMVEFNSHNDLPEVPDWYMYSTEPFVVKE
jgi:hypothetical protein